jgi:ATP-dependent Clp protease ATP-binding subunit ClpA
MDLQLKELYTRLENQKLKLELSDEARELILRRGYDAANGARPLRRAIERLLTRPLSARILEESFNSGDTIRTVLSDDKEHLKFEAVVHSP